MIKIMLGKTYRKLEMRLDSAVAKGVQLERKLAAANRAIAEREAEYARLLEVEAAYIKLTDRDQYGRFTK